VSFSRKVHSNHWAKAARLPCALDDPAGAAYRRSRRSTRRSHGCSGPRLANPLESPFVWRMDLESLSRRSCLYHMPTFGQQRPDEVLHSSFSGTPAAQSAIIFGMSGTALNSFRHTPVTSADGSLVFPHDPIPHVRNQLCTYQGLQIEGRWTTKDGERVMLML